MYFKRSGNVKGRRRPLKKLLDKTASGITVSEQDVLDFYNANKEQFVRQRGVTLSMIKADAISSGVNDDARSEAEARQKIDAIYQQLKDGADFATVARARSEDTKAGLNGGDIGFATEKDLEQSGFPQTLIRQFFGPMQPGEITQPVNFAGSWYIFKLTEKQLQPENLTLESPGVRSQVKEGLINQRKQAANAALLETAKNQAKTVNYLASKAD
ncbi:MAG TPA: peptidylprolyl isomerase [Pyrinomonadaceae bacterium]